jgi:hypothetical protein
MQHATINEFSLCGIHYRKILLVRMRRYGLYGLEAIQAANGWVMAFAGALIVMAGLAILSFVISQLHKALELWEKHSTPKTEESKLEETKPAGKKYDPEHPFLNMVEAVKHYRNASKELGDRFELKELYTFFYHSGFPHPHLTIRSLREEGHLILEGEGYFTWKKDIDARR